MGDEAGEEHRLIGAHHLPDNMIDVVVGVVLIIGYLALEVVLHNLVEDTSASIFGATAHGRV